MGRQGEAIPGLPDVVPVKTLEKKNHKPGTGIALWDSPFLPFLSRAEPLVYLVGEVHGHS